MRYYGRHARNEAIAIFFTVATVGAVLRYLDTGHNRFMYYSAGFAALHFATKETAFIFTAQLLVFLGLLFIYRISKREWADKNKKVIFLYLLGLTLLLVIAALAAAMLLPGEIPVEAAGEAVDVEQSASLLTQLPLILGGGAGLMFLAAFIVLLLGYRWSNLRNERSFDLMMLQLLLVFPQLAAFPAFWLKLPVSDIFNTESIIKIAPFLIGFWVVSLIFGALWKWKEWLINAGIYYGLFILFYTSFFTNLGGVYTGLIGSLGYWLEQHGVERGSQPDYYFHLIQLPIYEYLAAIGVLIVTILAIVWLVRRSRTENDEGLTLSEENESSQLPQLDRKVITLSMLLFFSFTSTFAYSLVGEKMPWLTVHITWSMWMATGWLIGRIINRVQWKQVLTERGAIAVVWFSVMLVSFFTAVGMFFNDKMPFKGQETEQLTNTNVFLMLILVALSCGLALYKTTSEWEKGQPGRFTALGIFGMLALFTARTAFTASYINYDRANEYLVYAHAARGPKDALEQVEDISLRLTGGTEVQVAYDNHTMYPFWWYLREYPNRFEYGENPTLELREYPLILVGDGNYHKLDPIVRDDYILFEYVRMIWPNQDYFDLGYYKPYLTSAETRTKMLSALFQVWFNRDFDLYGEVTGQNTSDRYWNPSQTFRLYIRKDVVYQIWEFGSSPGGLDLMVDEYAEGYIPLVAGKTFGDLGLNAPRGVATAPDGSVYVADTGNNRILHVDQDGIVIGQVGTEGTESGQFNQPWGIDVDADGFVYATDTWNHRIQKFTADLEFITSWGYYGLGESGEDFYGPRDVAVDSNGQVFVTDTGNKRVVVFDSNGTFVAQFGGTGYLPGQLEEPVGVAVSPVDNMLYVADTWNQRVQAFEETIGVEDFYVSTTMWDIDGWFGQSLDNKPFLTVDELNNVIVADPENARVLIFATDGTFKNYFGEYDLYGPSGFGIISGISADDQGGVWVTDSVKNELKYFSLPR
jgi:DNA-binding beta-propeller fold protein YncE